MKLIAYVLFAVSVLLMSAFARADLMMHPLVRQTTSGSPVHVQKVENIDVATLKIYVSGTLPNVCTPDPTPEVTLEDGALVIRLLTPLQMEICADRAKHFGIVLDLPALVKASGLMIDTRAIYPVKTPGLDFIMNVSGAELLR